MRIFALLWLMVFLTTSAQGQIAICAQNEVAMPTLENHRVWLSNNERYGPEVAADFYGRAKVYGDEYLQFQIHYFPGHPGASGWFDVVGLTGLRAAHKKQIRTWTCNDYPILLLIGIEPRSAKKGTLYVSRKQNVATVISLKELSKAGKPVAMRLERSKQLVCADVKTADFYADEPKCVDASLFFKR